MAKGLENIVTNRSNTFPNALAINASGPSATDGTEYVKDLINNYFVGPQQALLNEVGYTPDGVIEATGTSQEVMALKALIARHGMPRGLIGIPAAAPLTDRTITIGNCPDTTNLYSLRLTATLTKKINVAWVAGDNAGGMMGTVAANTEYGYYLAYNPTTKVTDAFFSVYTGAGVPTSLPTGFTVYQMVDWFKTDGSSQIIPYETSEYAPGVVIKHITTPIMDFIVSNGLTTSRRLDAIGVPTGFECMANINAQIFDATSTSMVYISYPDSADLAPSNLAAAPLMTIFSDINYTGNCVNISVKTNSARQIAARASLATVDAYQVSLLNFIWKRF